jgi:isopenicillin N synthase-like dioxygenase
MYQAQGLVDTEAAQNAKNFTLQSHETLLTILDSLTHVLQISTNDSLVSKHRINRASGDHVRLVRYNLPHQALVAQKVLLIPHTDFGTLTIIFSDRMGLQIFEPSVRRWQYVEPKPGLAVVNIGDALVKFTNGLLHSCLHRVVAPPVASSKQESTVKYSLGYFLRPEDEVQLRTIASHLIPQPTRPEDTISGKEWTDFRVNASKAEKFQATKDWSSVQGTAHMWQEAT